MEGWRLHHFRKTSVNVPGREIVASVHASNLHARTHKQTNKQTNKPGTKQRKKQPHNQQSAKMFPLF